LLKGADLTATNQVGGNLNERRLRDIKRGTLAELCIPRDESWSPFEQDGSTPLHLAAKRGRTTVIELLLNKGADVMARNQVGGFL
jgi:ankyrin repeat protein